MLEEAIAHEGEHRDEKDMNDENEEDAEGDARAPTTRFFPRVRLGVECLPESVRVRTACW